MPVPFKVKALFEYHSNEPDDLTFGDGQVITVTEDDDEDWYTGEYINGAGQKAEGIFPRNFVEKYEPVIPSRPARAPRRPAQPEVTESKPATEPAPTSPPIQQHVKEAEAEPTKEAGTSKEIPVEPEPAPAPKPVATESKPTKQPPPVAEKPTSSSFKDRIAAFNKPAAAPVTPFKPQSGGGGGGFIKKAFVAPPPSRNAYVPPPREAPPPKVYRREEDPELAREEEEDERTQPLAPPKADHGSQNEEDDQPQPTSLKDRIALLQKQQMEQATRQADAAKKKEKPKRPSKPRLESQEAVEESTEAPIVRQDTEDTVGKQSLEASQEDLEEAREHRQSLEKTGPTMPLPQPSRELVSDTNDADDSGAADTEDAQETSTEEERVRPKATIKSPEGNERVEAKETAATVDQEDERDEDDEEDEDEEEDPEVRRRRELRERMAKMSGGMGMMGMLGGGMPAARKAKASKEEKLVAQPPEEEVTRAPPVPIMALPGMSNKQKPRELDSESDQDDTAHPTPMDTKEAEDQDDYISQRPVRRSTDRSLQERAPPPPPPSSRPEPPTSPGSRPVPPPPPPSKAEGDFTLAQNEFNDERPALPPPSTRSLPPPPPTGPRGAPPPPPGQSQSSVAPESPSGAPPIPMNPTSPQTRAPPPPPPGQPPSRRSTVDSARSKPKEDSEEEVTEYDGDYDTDIASSAKHKDALKAHNRDSSFEEETLTDEVTKLPQSPPARAVPPVPQAAPRDLPPPPPTQAPSKPRKSTDAPRAAPPPIPSTSSPTQEDEYDPYRYTAPQHGLPGMVAALRSPTEELETDEMYDATPQATRVPPPPPPTERMAPLPPSDRGMALSPEDISMSGALAAPEQRNRQSFELGRSSTTSRRSGEAPRASVDKGFIASDLDLAQPTMWWMHENTSPPAVQGRSDVLCEVESSTSQKRGGKTSITRDVYILYQDYSQTTINVTFDPADPSHALFEQNHERPPMPPRKDQLENASEAFGAEIARMAEKASGGTIGEGNAHEFVSSLLRPLSSALMPVGTRAYGALVYANLANASTQQMDEIRPGDIVTFRNAKFAGHKGNLHQKYSMDVGKPEHVGVVIDWDGTKKKIRAWEQGKEEKGKKNKVREESYRVSDLKSGEVRVWRVMPRSYVQWSS